MTLSLKQRAEEIVYRHINTKGSRLKNLCAEVAQQLEEAYQEGRESGIREAANIADDFSPDPEYGRKIAKIILELLPPPKTGKP